jgi:multidrug resistance efflux pump
MEALLLGIYSFFVWLIFIKFKWLPWNTKSQVIVVIIPIVALTALILLLNIFAPSSPDVRVIKYSVQIVPQVRGRVIQVPVEGNRHYKKGEVLFRIDPTPYQQEVDSLAAQVAQKEAGLNEALARIPESEAGVRELRESLRVAGGQVESVKANLELSRVRVAQHNELVAAGAGDKFALEQAQTNVSELEAQLYSARATEAQVKQKLSALYKGDNASVAAAKAQAATSQAQIEAAKAQLAKSQWELSQTTVYAPANGYVINLQLRPGAFVVTIPLSPAMTFVEDEYQIVALYHQNELWQVKPGDEAEVALKTMPGQVLKAKVDSIVWAQGQGQLPVAGQLPQTGAAPQVPGRFAVKLDLEQKHHGVFLAAGAGGDAAIYTQGLKAIQIIRKVILRVGSYLNYVIPKLH